jgi:hypothetical protein
MRHLALILAVLPVSALACQNDSDVFSCQVGKKVLEICHWKGALIYSFGAPGTPDLTIAQPLETAEYTPWPGVGSAIWEMVTFQNQGHVYEVVTSVDRDPGGDQTLQGGVFVTKDEALVAEVRCDPGTASNALDVIWELKESIGQCWDFETISWQTTCSN